MYGAAQNTPLTGEVVEVPGWAGRNDAFKLRVIRQIVEKYGGEPQLRWHAAAVLQAAGVQPRDYVGQARAILNYAQGMYYTNEPGEQIQSPMRTIAVRTGDCDDTTVLAASMAESIGLPWRLMLAGNSITGRPIRHIEGNWPPLTGNFSHIYLQFGWPPFKPTKWASAETTIKGAPLGYDVVLHGVSESSTGQVTLPGLGTWGMVLAPDGIQRFLDPAIEGEEKTFLQRLDWAGIATRVVEGVAVALILSWVLRKK